MGNKLIEIGNFLTNYITIPILIIFIIFVIKYLWNGFSKLCKFYKENGRFMNEDEKQEWLNRNRK